jgi:alpha-mannosidase
VTKPHLLKLRRTLPPLAAWAVLFFSTVWYASPQPLQRIYIAPDDHTDYMWAGNVPTYRRALLEMLDYYLDLTDQTAGNPSPYQSRFACDGSFWMWNYEKHRSAAQFQRLLGRIADGHISVPLTTLVSCHGGTPAEAVLRGLYYAGRIERRSGLRFPLAVAMENQTLPYGLGSLWAGAGARYSWRGICNCKSKVDSPGDREHDIYWWTGPDGSRVLMKWNSSIGSNRQLGGYAEAFDPAQAVEDASAYAGGARYPYQVIGSFGRGWDGLETLTDAFVPTAQTKTNATRQVIVSNEQDFFQDFEATYGGSLPAVAASFGNEWDLYCASMAEVSASVKRAVEKLRSAEAMAALVALADPSLLADRSAARDQAFVDLGLYWEHDWTGDGPAVSKPQRAAWQRRLAAEIGAYVDSLASDGAAALGRLIRRPRGAPRFFVFNPLGFARTDVADYPYAGPLPVHAIDVATGLEAPSQIVQAGGAQQLRILAAGVPAAGYKVFAIAAGPGAVLPPAAAVAGGVIESDRYRVTVAPRGAIVSLLDKGRGGRELVQPIAGLAANDLGAGDGALTVENAGPVSVTLLATSGSPLAHTSRITLVRDVDRVEIADEITQNFGDVRTWSFGFNLPSPDLWHEEVGAVIRARLLADGGHYSPRNARYDWLTLNHFADMTSREGPPAGVTLSNADAYFMRLGDSAPGSLDTATPRISVLAGGQVDPPLGIDGQGGDSYFLQRFALRGHDAFDAAAAMRFALAHQNPLVTGAVTGRPRSPYPGDSYSLVTISNPDAILWALKPAEEGIGGGIVVRLWNLNGQPVPFTLALPQPLAAARQTTHVETNLAPAPVVAGALQATLGARQLQTWRLLPGRR